MSEEPVAYVEQHRTTKIYIDVVGASPVTVRYGKRKFVPDRTILTFFKDAKHWQPCGVSVSGFAYRLDGTIGDARYGNDYLRTDVEKGNVPAWVKDIMNSYINAWNPL